jgi:hypothetical protein
VCVCMSVAAQFRLQSRYLGEGAVPTRTSEQCYISGGPLLVGEAGEM